MAAYGIVCGSGAWAESDGLWATAPGDLNRSFNLRLKQNPVARALPNNAAEVVQALHRIRETDQKFAVQSSGHCFAGLSQTDGALIDLRRLNDVSVLPAHEQLIAGPGASLAAVNVATSKYGLVLPAGYFLTVALGGHIGGGGIGILSRKYGLACDHLIAAKVALADGQIVTADQTQNADLLWAFRGGGAGSFCIETEYRFALQKPPAVILVEYYAMMSPQDAARWMVGWQKIVDSSGSDFGFITYLNGVNAQTVSVKSRLVSVASQQRSIPIAKAIADLAPLSIEPQLKAGQFQNIADHLWSPNNYPAQSTYITSDFLAKLAREDNWHTAITAMAANPQPYFYLSSEALGGAIETPARASAYAHRGARYLVQYSADVREGAPLADRKATIEQMQRRAGPSNDGRRLHQLSRPIAGQLADRVFRR